MIQLTPEQAQTALAHFDQSARYCGAALSSGGLQQAAAIRDALASAVELAGVLQAGIDASKQLTDAP